MGECFGGVGFAEAIVHYVQQHAYMVQTIHKSGCSMSSMGCGVFWVGERERERIVALALTIPSRAQTGQGQGPGKQGQWRVLRRAAGLCPGKNVYVRVYASVDYVVQ